MKIIRSIKPWYIAVAYLLTIIFFAFIYYILLPDHFYHSTSKYEKSLEQDLSIIKNEFCEAIFSKIDFTDGKLLITDNAYINSEDLYLLDFEINEDQEV